MTGATQYVYMYANWLYILKRKYSVTVDYVKFKTEMS